MINIKYLDKYSMTSRSLLSVDTPFTRRRASGKVNALMFSGNTKFDASSSHGEHKLSV